MLNVNIDMQELIDNKNRLKNLPISFFSIVMGLTGFAIVWQKIEQFLKFDWNISLVLFYFSISIFFLLIVLYAIKWMYYIDCVKKEYNNPVKINFFPTISISLLLLSIASYPLNNVLSFWMWLVGAVLHLIFTYLIISGWVSDRKYEIEEINPAWFIPVVGNILVPVVGVEHAWIDVSWFYFSIGLVFWIALFTIVFYRIVFHKSIVSKLIPTMFIMVAPPSVGFISYVKMTGLVDNFARILYFFALFLFIFFISKIFGVLKNKFYLSWWAYSFPAASMTIATILYWHTTGNDSYRYLIYILTAIISIIIITLLISTIVSMRKKQICVEE
jgi:tellurite resistance protein